MPTSDDSDAVDRDRSEPTVAPTVRELLLARIDEHCRLLSLELDQVAKACEQLAPERARSSPGDHQAAHRVHAPSPSGRDPRAVPRRS
jgi:hypothetical protein